MKKLILLLLFLLSSSALADNNGPDFVVTDITLIPASPKNGSTFKAKVTVKNKGTSSGDAGLLTVWADQPVSRNCQAGGGKSISVGILNPGVRRTLTVTSLFAGADVGRQKILRAFVNSTCESVESNDNNNQSIKVYGHIDDGDAGLMALELSDTLLASRILYLQLRSDLMAIRQAYPEVKDIHHLLRWQPGVVLAKITPKQIAQINASELGPVTAWQLFDEWYSVQFAIAYNPITLNTLLQSRFGVVESEVNSTLGGDGSDIVFNPSSRIYTFSIGWGDCIAGCIYHQYWDFTVSSIGLVTLLREY